MKWATAEIKRNSATAGPIRNVKISRVTTATVNVLTLTSRCDVVMGREKSLLIATIIIA